LDVVTAEGSDTPPKKSLVEKVRERKEEHKQRGKLYRFAVAFGGVLLVLLGLALSLPGVPGPGLLIVAAGVAVLALEFDRAERLLERILVRVERVSDQAKRASPLQKALVATGVVLAAAAAVVAVVALDVPLTPF
jgi:uncharacterized protein (TIGR02611 family)